MILYTQIKSEKYDWGLGCVGGLLNRTGFRDKRISHFARPHVIDKKTIITNRD